MMLGRVNASRATRGLVALRPSGELDGAAARHAADLASGRVNLNESHIGSDGSTAWGRAVDAGYRGQFVREMTGWGWGGDYDRMMQYWLESPVHNPIIFDAAVNEIGEAFLPAPGTEWGYYWVVVVGRGLGVVTPPAPLPGDHVVYAPIVVAPGAGAPAAAAIDLLRFKLADPDCWRVVRNPHGQQEDVQDMELGGGLFVRRKNSLGEWHRYDDGFFYLVHDTSPAPGEEGIERVYTLFKNGRPGAPKSKRFQAVGEAWHEAGLHRVQFRAWDDCRPLEENSGEAQNHSTIVRHARNFTFNSYGQNLTFDEVIWEKTGAEMQIYGRMGGRSCGWIGWEAPWGKCEPVEIRWDRPRLTREPERVCGF